MLFISIIMNINITIADIQKLKIYLNECIKNKTNFYYLNAHESYLDYPDRGSDTKWIKQKLNGFIKLKKNDKPFYFKKFIIEKYEIKPDPYCKSDILVINNLNDDAIILDNIICVKIDNKVFYTSLMSEDGHMDCCDLTIPVELFDNLTIDNTKQFKYSVMEKIDGLNDYDRECVDRILHLFNIDKDFDDFDIHNHKNFKILKKMLKVYDLFD